MAHYAKVLQGIVQQVIVAEADFFDTFVDDSPGTWIQTSYNTHEGKNSFGEPLRKNFAAIGMNYDGIGFYENAPYPILSISAYLPLGLFKIFPLNSSPLSPQYSSSLDKDKSDIINIKITYLYINLSVHGVY